MSGIWEKAHVLVQRPWLPPGVTRPSAGWRVDAGGTAERQWGQRKRVAGPAAWQDPAAAWMQTSEVNLPWPLGSRAVGAGGCAPEVPAASIKLQALGVPDLTLMAPGTVLPDLAASGVILSRL